MVDRDDLTPEMQGRKTNDELLTGAGWQAVDVGRANIQSARGIAMREFPLKSGHGFADYLLYTDGKAAGVVEAKKEGAALSGVETQSAKYRQGLHPAHDVTHRKSYES